MKWFILSFMSVLLLSCQGKASSGTEATSRYLYLILCWLISIRNRVIKRMMQEIKMEQLKITVKQLVLIQLCCSLLQ